MANAMAVVAGRSARPCDVCARKRSRWYCAADEAYLCEGCDSSVHAANALAFRHERVRLTPNGAPMKLDRRSNVNHSEHPNQSTPSKKKLQAARPSSNSATAPFPPLQQPHEKYVGGLREVKLELNAGNCGTTNDPVDPSDDHFTAEELTGNANVLDDSSMCPPSYDGSSNPDYSHGLAHGDADFAHDFLVSDPNDPHNSTLKGESGTHGSETLTTSSAGGGDVVDQCADDDDEEEEEEDDCVGTEWMDLANRDLSGDDEYCIDPTALRNSISSGAPDQSVAVYSHDEKPDLLSDGGVSPSLHHMEKVFKNMAGQSEWAKPEDGYGNYGVVPQQQQHFQSACKMEGLAMGAGGDLRQVPSLRLNYADVLSSWPDRGMRWTDDGSGSQLVPDDSNSDARGGCYDLGLVPDLSSPGCGMDGSGHFAPMYGGCGSGGMGGTGMGDDCNVANACNGREARVSRYREKRRTRLFSKKIRYEVRKLNAERRPRMKGRFVKRSPGHDS